MLINAMNSLTGGNIPNVAWNNVSTDVGSPYGKKETPGPGHPVNPPIVGMAIPVSIEFEGHKFAAYIKTRVQEVAAEQQATGAWSKYR
jgi:hypothetical protein